MNDIPFIKDVAFDYGKPDAISPLITRVIANNPGPYTYTGSGTYIVGTNDQLAIIDPGPDLDAHIDALINTIGARQVSHIFVTHTHKDHCGAAMKLSDRVNAPNYAAGGHPVATPSDDAPPLEEGADYGFEPDHLITHGEIFSGPNWTIEAVATPGHLSNHFCFALKEEKTLFTGDHIMGWATTVIAPPDGDMGDYFDSLQLLLDRDDKIYFPTHGAPIKEPHRFVRAVKTHRHIRDGQIMEQLRKGRTKITDIVAVLYADIDKRLHIAAALNVFAHLQRLVKIGEVICDEDITMNGTYRLTAK